MTTDRECYKFGRSPTKSSTFSVLTSRARSMSVGTSTCPDLNPSCNRLRGIEKCRLRRAWVRWFLASTT